MSLPLWDDLELLPEGWVLVDINGLTPETLRTNMQGMALQAYMDATGNGPVAFVERDWSDDEAMFAIHDPSLGPLSAATVVGVHLVIEVEDA